MSFHWRELPISVVLGLVMVMAMVKNALIGDARWWNLVMAVLLLAILGLYLLRERRGSR